MGKEHDMKRQLMVVDSLRNIQKNIYYMTLTGDCHEISAPGQFINIKLDGFYLRRPISICDYDDGHASIVFQVVGPGTQKLSKAKRGSLLDVLIPLGNGFDISRGGSDPILVSGGIGLPPIYCLAKEMVNQGKTPRVICGFNGKDDVFPMVKFHDMGVNPIITTIDGSVGVKGLVTDALSDESYNYIYACGPEPMLKALWEVAPDGQFSFEARMACGFGACMGCSCKTKYGSKRICKDGPVLYREEIIW
jgi:dihydroorotate dehydrogenase electron transfer subunit